MSFRSAIVKYVLAALLIGCLFAGGLAMFAPWSFWPFGMRPGQSDEGIKAETAESARPAVVELSDGQIKAIKTGQVETRRFQRVSRAVGSIDFNQDLSVQVSSQYAGKIVKISAALGDRVERGQVLYSIESPDLLTAEATLLQTSGVIDLTTRNLGRLRGAQQIGGSAQKDLDQAVSDQQTAEGNFKSARIALAVFGKTNAEIDQIVSSRKLDSMLSVLSPISGTVTARNGAPGLFVQPGNSPAPLTVTDVSTMWMNSFVDESEVPLIGIGQAVSARVQAYADRQFDGKVTMLGSSVDPATHRLLVRCQIDDPDHFLRPGMFASFVIKTAAPINSPGIAQNSVVREGDGSLTAWVAIDPRHFEQRTVKVGIQQDGLVQVLDGLRPGETIAVDGAIFLSNVLSSGSTD
jgi:cobalt-zinc-cadmium efflux system membrane fusion protein